MADSPHDEVMDRLVRLQADIYDQGARYTNLIIAAGYGAFFGLWTLTREYLTPTAARIAALCALASASIFILAESLQDGAVGASALWPRQDNFSRPSSHGRRNFAHFETSRTRLVHESTARNVCSILDRCVNFNCRFYDRCSLYTRQQLRLWIVDALLIALTYQKTS